MCAHAHLGEVHLGPPPQDESLGGEDVRYNTEQHEEDGHRHHNHIMANAARDREASSMCLCA